MTVAAVIVTYNSDISRLQEILNSLSSCDKVVISDNSTSDNKRTEIKDLSHKSGFDYLSMSGNHGIAKAQNVGITHAVNAGMADVVLLDDDSLPTHTMISELFSARKRVYDELGKLPVVCATAFGDNKEMLSVHGEKIINGVYKCRDIISSGTLLNRSHIDLVGLHEEKLFIDCVDYEWGWRAISKNVVLCIVISAVLNHRLGTGKLNYIDVRYGSPIRHYYQYRNILHMIKRDYVPLSWKLEQLPKLLFKLLLISLFFDNKAKRLKFALMGVRDFCLGKYGPINNC